MHAVLFEAAYAAPDGRKRSSVLFFARSTAEAEQVARGKEGAGVLAGMSFVALVPRHPVETGGLQRVPPAVQLALPLIERPAVQRRPGGSRTGASRSREIPAAPRPLDPAVA